MNLNENNAKKVTLIIVAILLGIIVFFIMRPVMMAMFGGLILAYVFKPVYNTVSRITKSRNLSSLIVSLLVILIILIPLWFVVPIMLQQVFDLYSASQAINYQQVAESIFPTASPQFLSQISISLSNFVGKVTSKALESLNGTFLNNLPNIALQFVIVFFVFFYAMRDSEELKKFFSELSPFSSSKEKVIIQEFKNVTDSVVYGQIIIGFVQGGLAGLGLLLFGVKNVLALTVLAVFLSILPILGPFLIWIPVTFFLFTSGQANLAIGYLIYNIIIVSFADNLLRAYIISRKTALSPAVILASMIGGFFFLGIMGFLIGPLLVSYFLMILRAYKDKSLQTLIHEN